MGLLNFDVHNAIETATKAETHNQTKRQTHFYLLCAINQSDRTFFQKYAQAHKCAQSTRHSRHTSIRKRWATALISEMRSGLHHIF